ncbi:dTDP-4-dehydrorhamnose reductase [Micromonospora schwarzwaldensis]|uniref:dTDP-4-dehydrorhamnose reductase n=1 Tax=Micromonospora sp. DSM 45708 TaxID=3111767 RepID=UPI0031D615DA
MTRLLVTGAGGMLGRDLLAVLRARPDRAVTATTRADLDVTDPAAVHDAVGGHDVVLNAAAWTDVDGAQTRERDATAVNGDAVAYLARACAATGAKLVHVSTDYVFGGDATRPYPEHAPTGPVNAYGRSKLAGERAVARLLPDGGYVVRTAWLYGTHGRNFVTTVLRLATERDRLDVVADQHGQPTWSYRLAERLVALADAALAGDAPPGVYHGTSGGETTWYGLARAVFTLRGLDPERVRPTTSDRFPRPAPRPRYSVLAHDRWAAAKLPPPGDWLADLTEALTGLNDRRPGTPPPRSAARS